jgi:2-oxoisovalerate dehydrogenase E2 component (dihydrolipoyl transacylase)
MDRFLLPDLGEGLEDAEIVAWHVNEGDHVVADQLLVSVETDKAIVELPSPESGRIGKLFGAKGDVVKVGAPLVEFDTSGTTDTGTVVGSLEPHAQDEKPAAKIVHEQAAGARASPAVRALAQKLNVSLELLTPTGPDGTITRADVERAARSKPELGAGEPLRGMRRAMAVRMATAHREVAPAGVMDDADIGDWGKAEDITVRIILAIAVACKAEPSLNAHYFSEAGVRHLIERIDVGIAVDTEDGLIVPVIRNVAQRDVRDLRAGLDRLRRDAAARVVPPEELKGATITLSNFGMFGGRYAHLVIVPPQVAIIGAGRVREKVVPHKGVPAIRRSLPLTLLFDHRAVTGGEGARFFAKLEEDLERPI